MPRKRQMLMQFFVTEEEKMMIEKRMELMQISSKSDYLRSMAMDGAIINVDTKAIRDMTQAINRIGININQIARLGNESGLYEADIESVKESLEKVWQLQRSILSQQR